MSETLQRTGGDLLCLMTQVSHALTAEVMAALEDVGISQRTYNVLQRAMEGEYTQVRLAELAMLDKTTMVTTLDDLERAGLAERRPSSTDRRARIVAVTEAGRRKVVQAQAVVSRVYDDVLATLPDAERQGLVDALSHLIDGRLAQPVECERMPRRARGHRGV